jgi:hypothetical protein
MNPRVLLWLQATGLTLADIEPRDGESARITRGSHRLPWSIFFSEWIMARWDEWARGLHFTPEHGSYAHEVAQLYGHTAEEFDAWLKHEVESSTAPLTTPL